MRYSLQDEYGYSGTIRYVRIAGVRILYGRIICGRRIFFELQYGTSTVRVQSYKFEYSTSKRRGHFVRVCDPINTCNQGREGGYSTRTVLYLHCLQ